MSTAVTSIQSQHRHWHPGFATKVALVLVAILAFTLTTAGLEARLGALPSDPAIACDFGGE